MASGGIGPRPAPTGREPPRLAEESPGRSGRPPPGAAPGPPPIGGGRPAGERRPPPGAGPRRTALPTLDRAATRTGPPVGFRRRVRAGGPARYDRIGRRTNGFPSGSAKTPSVAGPIGVGYVRGASTTVPPLRPISAPAATGSRFENTSPETVPGSRPPSPSPGMCMVRRVVVPGIANVARDASGRKLPSRSPRISRWNDRARPNSRTWTATASSPSITFSRVPPRDRRASPKVQRGGGPATGGAPGGRSGGPARIPGRRRRSRREDPGGPATPRRLELRAPRGGARIPPPVPVPAGTPGGGGRSPPTGEGTAADAGRSPRSRLRPRLGETGRPAGAPPTEGDRPVRGRHDRREEAAPTRGPPTAPCRRATTTEGAAPSPTRSARSGADSRRPEPTLPGSRIRPGPGLTTAAPAPDRSPSTARPAARGDRGGDRAGRSRRGDPPPRGRAGGCRDRPGGRPGPRSRTGCRRR